MKTTEKTAVTKPKLLDFLTEALTRPGKVSEAYSVLHRYSTSNVIWVMAQLITRGAPLGPVASFNKWKELGRTVKKGERALAMYMPVMVKDEPREDAEPGAVPTRRVIFVVRNQWFTVHQTDPMEGAPGASEALTAHDGTESVEWNAALALERLGIEEEDFFCLDGGVLGYAKTEKKVIAVSPIADHPGKTRFHEIAHCLLHAGEPRFMDGKELGRSLREVEAEATAYLCCAMLGLTEGLETSRGYIQSWLSVGAEPFAEKNARRVFGAVDKILRAGRPAEREAEETVREAA